MNNQKEFAEINKILSNAFNDIDISIGNNGEPIVKRTKSKGTATYYIAGTIENRKFCYTLQRTSYKERFGFWSWIQTSYQNGKIKRTKFAKSGSKIKAQDRARRLYETELMKQDINKLGVQNG